MRQQWPSIEVSTLDSCNVHWMRALIQQTTGLPHSILFSTIDFFATL